MESIITNVIIAFIILTIILILFVLWKSLKKKGYSPHDTKFFNEKWQQIVDSSQHDPRHAILDADKLIDIALRKKGYSGTVGENLKTAKSLFSNLNGIWDAHKTRNKIAHELDYHISPQDCKRHLSEFKRALRDLGLKL